MTDYYSDRVSGPRARVKTKFDERSWGAVVSCVQRGIPIGVFAQDFPLECTDGETRAVFGTNERQLGLAVEGELPEIDWPLVGENVPDTPAALDLIEFFHRHATEASKRRHHAYWDHDHLAFNRKSGQAEFRSQINTIFARNGLAYELEDDGKVQRLLELPLMHVLQEGLSASGDAALDRLIREAESRFLDPDPQVARDALEKLWDAFERAKTIIDPENKKQSAEALARAATIGDEVAAERISAEMIELTNIGNAFRIRHHETNKGEVTDELVDYLFLRMYSLLRFLLAGLGQG